MGNTPNIRFKGFTDDWEQRKFSELVTIERGGSPRPIDKFITKDENGLNWVKIGDAPEQGNYITKTAEKIKPEGLSKTREVHPGDLILSNSMSFGRPYIMAIDGCIHDGWLAIRDTNKKFDLKFLCIMLGTDNMLSQYKAMAAGSTVNNLNKGLVGGTIVSYPSMDEQVKLGEYFSNLDNLITLHQRKCDETKELKKFMLQKMFPKNGEKKPEIRFEGFTDDWEQRKLEDLLEKYEDPVETPHDGYERVGIRSHAKGTFHSFVEPGKELDTAKMHRVAADKFILNITFAWEHAVAITDESDAGKLVSHRFPQFSFNKKLKSHFFKYLMLDRKFKEHLELSSPGGAGRNRVLKISDMLKYKINLPSVEEQIKIGEYFDELDNLITLHQRKCDEIKEIKKFMLQNMFPQKG